MKQFFRCHARNLSPGVLHSIENMWSKIKQILRSLAPRTQAELIAAAKLAFNAIIPADCHGFLFTRPRTL